MKECRQIVWKCGEKKTENKGRQRFGNPKTTTDEKTRAITINHENMRVPGDEIEEGDPGLD
jgi:hypothetical protein